MNKSVIFDFDGVIVDSNHIKTEAFRVLFYNFSDELQQKIVDYHIKNEGLSRFIKLEYIFDNILDIAISTDRLKAYAKRYGELVINKIIDLPLKKGVLSTLTTLIDNKIKAFIVSATPEYEIKMIIKKKGLSNFFDGVYGSPENKSDIIKKIAKNKNLDLNSSLYLGDSLLDYQTAIALNIMFIGIGDPKNHIFPKNTKVSNSVIDCLDVLKIPLN